MQANHDEAAAQEHLPCPLLLLLADRAGSCAAMRATCKRWRDALDAACEHVQLLSSRPSVGPDDLANMLHHNRMPRLQSLATYVPPLSSRFLIWGEERKTGQSLSGAQLVAALRNAPSLRQLTVHGLYDSSTLAELTQLTGLSMLNCDDYLPPASFSGYPSIWREFHPGMPFGQCLPQLAGLKDLHLYECHGADNAKERASASGLLACTALTRLSLHDTPQAGGLTSLTALTNLQELSSDGNSCDYSTRELPASLRILQKSRYSVFGSTGPLAAVSGLQPMIRDLPPYPQPPPPGVSSQLTRVATIPSIWQQHQHMVDVAGLISLSLDGLGSGADLHFLDGLHSLRSLSLSCSDPLASQSEASWPQLSVISNLSQLHSLTLSSRNSITDWDLGWVTALAALTYLCIQLCILHNDSRYASISGTETWGSLSCLRSLRLFGFSIAGQGTLFTSLDPWCDMLRSLQQLSNLSSVSLRAGYTQQPQDLSLQSFTSLTNLTHLTISPRFDHALVVPLSSLTKLQSMSCELQKAASDNGVLASLPRCHTPPETCLRF